MRIGKFALCMVLAVVAGVGMVGAKSAWAQDGPNLSASPAQADTPSQVPSDYSGLSDKELFDKCTSEMKNGNDDAELSIAQALLARYPFLQDQKRVKKLPVETQKLLQQASMRIATIGGSQQYFAETGVRLAKIGHGVSAPQVTHQVPPDLSGLPGGRTEREAVVNLIVDERGLPQNVHVIQSAGTEMDAQAVRAVKQYRFKPAKENGKPVPVMLNVEINVDKF